MGSGYSIGGSGVKLGYMGGCGASLGSFEFQHGKCF